ncbi:LAMI_0F05842g1_1 [Lachancea mirantina]|uniref:LAMI_0F05842g1_1 n=1 Tax=Lachancea mirantina TaxID=1230905 RepID=A0A1G4JYL4_9SACH|nr:LAMI_0F05842g1_1 [Lachancea mirantina]
MEASTTTAPAVLDEWLFPDAARLGSFGDYDAPVSTFDFARAPVSESSECVSSSAGSPLDNFSSLFDAGMVAAGAGMPGSDSDTLFTASNTVSLTNSPGIKQEDADARFLYRDPAAASEAALAVVDAASAEDTQTDAADSTAAAAAADAAGSAPDGGARRKRAPRKRLTAHQKQAHNKIEKRYRININTKIAKLQQIIPWVASEETAFEVGDAAGRGRGSLPRSAPGSGSGSGSGLGACGDSATCNSSEASSCNSRSTCVSECSGGVDVGACAAVTPKLNKSMILEKAVDYILYLQNNERLYEMEVQRLKKELETLRPK